MSEPLTPEERLTEKERGAAWDAWHAGKTRAENLDELLGIIGRVLAAVPRLASPVAQEAAQQVEVVACRTCAIREGNEATESGECSKCGSDDWIYAEGKPTGYRVSADGLVISPYAAVAQEAAGEREVMSERLHALTPDEWVEMLWLSHFIVSWHHNTGMLPMGERSDMVDLLDPASEYEVRHPTDYVMPPDPTSVVERGRRLEVALREAAAFLLDHGHREAYRAAAAVLFPPAAPPRAGEEGGKP